MRVRQQITYTGMAGFLFLILLVWTGADMSHLSAAVPQPEPSREQLCDRVPGLGTSVRIDWDWSSTPNATLYQVTAWNYTYQPIELDSVAISVEEVMDSTTGDPITTRSEIVNADGRTLEGKAYFRIPVSPEATLAPGQDTPAVTVGIRAPVGVRHFSATFRVRQVPHPNEESVTAGLINTGGHCEPLS